MKTYGIFLNYHPLVSLGSEGLGRLLAEMLKHTDDTKYTFCIACPSWMRTNLRDLFSDFGIDEGRFCLIVPEEQPALLILYMGLLNLRKRKGKRRIFDALQCIWSTSHTLALALLKRLLGTTSMPLLLGCSILLAGSLFLVLLLASLFFGLYMGIRWGMLVLQAGQEFLIKKSNFKGKNKFARFFSLIRAKQVKVTKIPLLAQVYNLINEAEVSRILKAIREHPEVALWFSPTSFWPEFNAIEKPRVMVVPDAVMVDFSIGFALESISNDEYNFHKLEKAIAEGTHFITYSEYVKHNTLVKHYGKLEKQIQVIPHGTNRLDSYLDFAPPFDREEVRETYVQKITVNMLAARFAGVRASYKETPFIFYATQVRPHKNIETLLHAYRYLIDHHHIQHKLVLTGTASFLQKSIEKLSLEHDVVCMGRLSQIDLAAFYKAADLAVNPSLSEGGCPFTFTEALSVGTPVVMGRIPVAEETITDPEVQRVTFFDPRDYKAMAEHIAWAINCREELLNVQIPFYKKLSKRSWSITVHEYIEYFDKIISEN